MTSPLPSGRPAATPRVFTTEGDCGREARGLMLQGCVQSLVLAEDRGASARFSPLLDKIRDVVLGINDADSVQGRLVVMDSYSLVLAMILHRDPRITPENCELFRLHPEMLPSALTQLDIGTHVRALLSGSPRNSFFLRVLEFALPMCKHNRLHFPALRECTYAGLVEITRLVMASCLGLYPSCERRAVWHVRVQVWFFFWNMLSQCNACDLHLFCTQHVALVKLAIIEYFFYSIFAALPVESAMLMRIPRGSNRQTLKSIAFHVDQFRHASFCHDSLDLSLATAAATVAIDKCVRLWKTRDIYAEAPGHARGGPASVAAADMRRAYRLALVCPCAGQSVYLMHTHGIDHETADLVRTLQQSVRVYPLPHNVMREQYAFMEGAIKTHGSAVARLVCIAVCLHCGLRASGRQAKLDHKMRLDRGETVCCSKCGSADAVAHINTIGRLVRVASDYLYFCWQCRKVHVWCADGFDLMQCSQGQGARAPVAGSPATLCVLCERRSQVELYPVLDDHLGIEARVPLCAWHTPLDNMKKLVHNFDSLIWAIKERQCDRRRK